MTTSFRQLTEEVFAAHWQQRLDNGEALSPELVRLAKQLTDLGYTVPVSGPQEQAAEEIVTTTPGDDQEAFASVSKKLHEYEWTIALPEFKSWLITTLGIVDGKYHVDETTEIETCTLDWYEQYKLVRLSDPHWINRRLRLYYLTGPNADLFRLNGTSPPIHEVNAKAPIKLTVDNVLSYLVFFCFFVHGEEGPFYIVETVDDPFVEAFRTLPVDPQLLETTVGIIEGNVEPSVLLSVSADGRYFCRAFVHYSNALFKARFAVAPTGMIEMLEDEPIAADMPTRIDAPLA